MENKVFNYNGTDITFASDESGVDGERHGDGETFR